MTIKHEDNKGHASNKDTRATTFNFNHIFRSDYKDDYIFWEKKNRFLIPPVPLNLVSEAIALLRTMMLRENAILLLKSFFLLIVAKYYLNILN